MANQFLKDLNTKRADWVKSSQENNFLNGINRLLTQLYPDNAHFIFELLQNAEDTEAQKVSFTLTKDRLIFTHNGRKFGQNDVEGITSIGEGTKATDLNKIGKFGVGFKAVFTYTSSPKIYSKEFNFQIDDLVVPKEIEPLKKSHVNTQFIFPFNNKAKQPESAYKEILKGLKQLDETSLLFLDNIQEIELNVSNWKSNIRLDEEKSGIIKIIKGKSVTHWLRFKKGIDSNSKLYVSLAFQLGIDKETNKYFIQKITNKHNGRVAVFFPCDKESSNLRFHIHAPFVTPVSRDSIVYDNEDNKNLRNILLELIDESIQQIKEIGLLDFRFISVLPIPSDNLNSFYEPIRERIVQNFQSLEYIKTDCGIFRSAQCVIVSNEIIKSFIEIDDWKFFNLLDNKKDYHWVKIPKSNSRASKLYNSLSLITYTIDNLLNSIEYALGIEYNYEKKILSEKQLYSYLSKKSNDWIKKLYEVIYIRKSNWLDEEYGRLIRLQNSEFNKRNEKCLFHPNYEVDYEKFNIVHSDTYDNTNNSNSFLFLEALGVTEIDEEQIVLSKLNQYEKGSSITIDDCLEDIKSFIQYINEHDNVEIFFNRKFLVANDGFFVSPETILLDEPYIVTGLTNLIPYTNKKLLHDCYSQLDDQKSLIRFFKKIGVKLSIPIKRIRIPYNHPNYHELKSERGQESQYYHYNQDYNFSELDNIKDFTIELSKCIWDSLFDVVIPTLNKRENVFFAVYRRTSQSQYIERPSTFCYQLRNLNWIPDKTGNFKRPDNIEIENLHPDLVLQENRKFFEYIGLGNVSEEKRQENIIANQRAKREFGYTIDELSKEGISKADLDQLIQNKRNAKKKVENTRPDLKHAIGMHSKHYENSDVNFEPDIITDENEYRENAQNILDEKINNPKSRRNSYTRRTTKVGLKETKRFLYTSYKGLCQICGYTFKKKNGKNYFKQFYFITSKISGQQTSIIDAGGCLSLCSNCYSVIKYGDFDMSQLLKKMSEVTNDDFDAFRESFPYDDNIPNCFKGFEDEVVIVPIRHKSESKYLIYTEEHFIHLFNMLIL